MNATSQRLLEVLSELAALTGAYSVREDGQCVARQSTEHIRITSQQGRPGLTVRVSPACQGEKVFIPACVTHGDVDDLVYNDFYIGAGADVTIVAGCGVHTDEGDARHNGIHRFFLEPGAHVLYEEKHIGEGTGEGLRVIDPVTEATLQRDAVLEMDTQQLSGVDRTLRKTRATLHEGAKLKIRERLLTEAEQIAHTEFDVELLGAGAGVDLVSRSVARGSSRQSYRSRIVGHAPCTGHSACDAIIDGEASVDATPELYAHHADASLIHEAAIGKIAGEQILKLRTLGLTEQQAEEKIIAGFLK